MAGDARWLVSSSSTGLVVVRLADLLADHLVVRAHGRD
jgi:hypothetical protein